MAVWAARSDELYITKRPYDPVNEAEAEVVQFVSYRRVSTEDQGLSGLGLEAQEAAILAFVRSKGGVLVGDFVEVMSGKDDERPELIKARAAAAKHKAVLIVSRLDRLSRDLAFIANFLKGERRGKRHVETPFIACDMPNADRTMLQIMGVFAEMERRRIGERTKSALDALKARGVKLGSPRPEIGSQAGVAARRAGAEAFKLRVRRSIEDIRARGVSTLSGIAAELNARDIRAPNGGVWSATQVSRVLA